jgi:hypothetical protein
LAREPCGLFCRQAGDVTNVLSRLARYFRSPAYLLMGLVLSMSIAGVWLLVTNVTQIRASLPIEVLHRDRELADLLYEVSRLEALLDRVRLGDTEIDNRDLRIAPVRSEGTWDASLSRCTGGSTRRLRRWTRRFVAARPPS